MSLVLLIKFSGHCTDSCDENWLMAFLVSKQQPQIRHRQSPKPFDKQGISRTTKCNCQYCLFSQLIHFLWFKNISLARVVVGWYQTDGTGEDSSLNTEKAMVWNSMMLGMCSISWQWHCEADCDEKRCQSEGQRALLLSHKLKWILCLDCHLQPCCHWRNITHYYDMIYYCRSKVNNQICTLRKIFFKQMLSCLPIVILHQSIDVKLIVALAFKQCLILG